MCRKEERKEGRKEGEKERIGIFYKPMYVFDIITIAMVMVMAVKKFHASYPSKPCPRTLPK